LENVKKQMSTGAMHVRQPMGWPSKLELPVVLMAMWLVFVSVPLYLGQVGLGWDGLNHQIYLGWVADSPRFDKDYMAASLQAYQFPYLYWPVYKLAALGVGGLTAGIVLSSLHLVTVPPVWMMAKALIPGKDWFDIALRAAAVALAFMSAVPLKTLEATGNDLLAAAPMLWAIALAFKAITREKSESTPSSARMSILSGLLGGVAVACKLSNGPLVVLLPFLFVACQGRATERLKWVLINAAAIGVGFSVTYGYWGYQLWLQFGNPLFPFYDNLFEPLRKMVGWQR
jgi:hypothetical protein